MRIPLDSSANIFLLRGNTKAAELVSGAVEILFPVIVIGKLLYGFRLGTHFRRNASQLHSFLANPDDTLANMGPVTADLYSRIAQY